MAVLDIAVDTAVTVVVGPDGAGKTADHRTGNRAFDGASGVETLFMVVRDEAPPLSIVAAHVPAPLRWIVDRCLSKDPEDRYVATRDLARDLQYIRLNGTVVGALAGLVIYSIAQALLG